jgi:hypothetical protein
VRESVSRELDLLLSYGAKRLLHIERNKLEIILALAIIIDRRRRRGERLRLIIHEPPGNLYHISKAQSTGTIISSRVGSSYQE